MTDRERWIVYPLIFLALGVALRDKLTRSIEHIELIGGETVQMDFKRGFVKGEASRAQIDFAQGLVQADTIRCKKLIVEDELDARQTITQRVAAKEIVIVGPDQKIRVFIGGQPDKPGAASPRGGQIVVFGPDAKAQVLLSPGVEGGEVAVLDKSLRLRLLLGGFAEGVMLAVETPGGEKIPFLKLSQGLDTTKIPPSTQTETNAEQSPEKTAPDTSSPGPPEPEGE